MPQKYDPTEDMSPLSLLLAGIGQGMNNTATGVKQAFGKVSADDVREQRRLDESLLSRGMGGLGSVLGSTASMVPVAFVPGANSLLGAAALGGGMGLLQPHESDGEMLRNAMGFGLLGPASMAGGRALMGSTRLANPRIELSR